MYWLCTWRFHSSRLGLVRRTQRAVPVTVDNFIRAETDLYFGGRRQGEGGLGKFDAPPRTRAIDNQTVIRLNRDTLYSSAVFDLDAGPVTITLPDAGERFMSLQVDQPGPLRPTVYGAGPHTLTRRRSARATLLVGIRTLVDPTDPEDVDAGPCAAGRDQGRARQGPASSKRRTGIRQARRRCAMRCSCWRRRCRISARRSAPRSEVDPVRHLIGTAAAWGGNPDKDAIYLNITPAKNDGDDRLQAERQGRAGRRLLVGQPLQRRRLLREERVQRLFAQQHHREEGCGRLGRRSSSAAATARFPTACRS